MSSVDVVNISRSYGGVEAIPVASISIARGAWSTRGAPDRLLGQIAAAIEFMQRARLAARG
jgi:hypothetical protein